MTIYKVTVNEWHHWKSSSESGYVEKELLFIEKGNMEKFLTNLENDPYWFNFKHEEIHDDKHKPYAKVVEMHTED